MYFAAATMNFLPCLSLFSCGLIFLGKLFAWGGESWVYPFFIAKLLQLADKFIRFGVTRAQKEVNMVLYFFGYCVVYVVGAKFMYVLEATLLYIILVVQ